MRACTTSKDPVINNRAKSTSKVELLYYQTAAGRSRATARRARPAPLHPLGRHPTTRPSTPTHLHADAPGSDTPPPRVTSCARQAARVVRVRDLVGDRPHHATPCACQRWPTRLSSAVHLVASLCTATTRLSSPPCRRLHKARAPAWCLQCRADRARRRPNRRSSRAAWCRIRIFSWGSRLGPPSTDVNWDATTRRTSVSVHRTTCRMAKRCQREYS